jgi:hypothetical protein
MSGNPVDPPESSGRGARSLVGVVVLAIALVAAACGGGSTSEKIAKADSSAKKKVYDQVASDAEKAKRDSAGADTTIQSGGSTTAPTTADAGAAPTSTAGSGGNATTTGPASGPKRPPQETAAQAKVVPADLPAGWSGTPATGLYAAILPCLSAVPAAAHPTAQADGDHFSIGSPDSSEQALSTTAVFPSDAVAKSVVDATAGSAFGQCMTGVLATSAQIQGASGGPLVPADRLPSRGDQTTWQRGDLKAADPAGGDTPIPVDAAVATIRTGPTVSFLLLVGTGSRLDQWVINDLSQGIADRQR